MAASKGPTLPVPRDSTRPWIRTPLNADTSSQPEGFTRRVLLNILEAFFRKPWLHLLPLILMLALGVASAARGDSVYRSTGTLSVTNESLLADLTNAAASPGLGFQSAATVTAQQIGELLGTDDFLTNVEKAAGIETLVQQGVVRRQDVRSSIGAFADGDNIVRVSSSSTSPELSQRLALATITSYKQWVVDSYVSQSTSTEQSLQQRVNEKQAAADQASANLTAFINQDPNTPIDARSPADQLQYQTLTTAADRASTQLVQAQDALDSATLQTDQAQAIVNQRVQVLDEPAVPVAPEGRLKKAVLTVAVFGVLGLLLSLASVIIAASLDRTVRVPNDVTARFGVDVLAVVPKIAR